MGSAIEVHSVLGPGLLEGAYEECLCRELDLRNLAFRQAGLPVRNTRALSLLADTVSISWWRTK